MDAAKELRVTKRLDPDRIGKVLKQTRDSMMDMTDNDLRALATQAEVDMGRCADASTTLREVSSQLANVMLTALEVQYERGLRIR